MWSKIRLAIYGTTALAGIIWPFYFINQFINLVRNGTIQGSAIDIGNAFFDDAWITPTSGFISADTAILLIAIFVFYAAEGRRLKLRLWGIYFPLTFIISLAFSFGAFMFIRELKTNKEINETNTIYNFSNYRSFFCFQTQQIQHAPAKKQCIRILKIGCG